MRVLTLLFVIGAMSFACKEQKPPVEEKPVVSAPAERVDVVEHYPNGVIKLKGLSVDGKREGMWQGFFENGYKASEAEYENGVRNGDIVVFYRNGMMRYQGRYYDDQRTGMWTFYDTLGIVIKKVDMDITENPSDSLFN